MRALIALLLLAPMVAAHGSPAVLDVEIQVIADDASDANYMTDGYDLQSVYIRDAYWNDEFGYIVRIIASGSLGLASEAELRFAMQAENATGTSLVTTDDATWETESVVVELLVEDGDFGAKNVNLQVFIPRVEAGADEGDHVVNFIAESYADGQLVDSSIGGMFILGQEIPTTGTGTTLESHETAAPDEYVDLNVTDGKLAVASLITTAGQHVSVRLGQATGWDVALEGQATFSLDESGKQELRILGSPGSGSLPVTATTDIGGHSLGYIVARDGALAWSSEPVSSNPTAGPNEDAPGFALPLLLAALVGLARRR